MATSLQNFLILRHALLFMDFSLALCIHNFILIFMELTSFNFWSDLMYCVLTIWTVTLYIKYTCFCLSYMTSIFMKDVRAFVKKINIFYIAVSLLCQLNTFVLVIQFFVNSLLELWFSKNNKVRAIITIIHQQTMYFI